MILVGALNAYLPYICLNLELFCGRKTSSIKHFPGETLAPATLNTNSTAITLDGFKSQIIHFKLTFSGFDGILIVEQMLLIHNILELYSKSWFNDD